MVTLVRPVLLDVFLKFHRQQSKFLLCAVTFNIFILFLFCFYFSEGWKQTHSNCALDKIICLWTNNWWLLLWQKNMCLENIWLLLSFKYIFRYLRLPGKWFSGRQNIAIFSLSSTVNKWYASCSGMIASFSYYIIEETWK